jgi:uncharacterized membrane protein
MNKLERNTGQTTPNDRRDPAIDESDQVLPEHVIKNIEAIASHHQRHQQETSKDRRVLEKIANFFGKPQFLYTQIIFFAIWIGCTGLAERKLIPKNFPLFDLHFHGLEVASLLITTEVLIYQNRQEKLSEERSHLMLQLHLLTEQEITKMISLIEELRRDLPNVKDRHDLEAEVMKQATDPQAILEMLQKNSLHSPLSTDEKPQTT